MKFYLKIDFPALDRLVDYLVAKDQKEVDFASTVIGELTARFTKSRTNLENVMKEGK